ncbi:hypothetical protein EDD11_000857 [Mortierella claussenii]|nr:hypothetical protein EDD11_000857 [Mortierella claussenii]
MRAAHTRSGKPIPFILTIFPVVFYFVLIGFGYYAFVVTLCVRLLRNDRVALGVILLILYHITFFMMLWAYAMVILTDPGRVTAEHQPSPQQPQVFIQTNPQPYQQQQQQSSVPQSGTQTHHGQEQENGYISHPSLQHHVEPHIQQVQEAHIKSTTEATLSSASLGSTSGVLIPGAQSASRAGYIHISEDPTAQGHPLWCSKCQHVKPERAHHCRVCKRCVLKMDHHCPWVLNCVGQDNYKFFVLFIAYTAIHCIYILISMIPLYLRYPDDTWAHQTQVIGMVASGVFGVILIVFTMTHVRLILLNRTTIEDHNTPHEEGVLPCLRKGWTQSEGEMNQGNERLYDLGYKENWQQAMGKGWKWVIPVRFPRPEGPIYNQKVVARQWRDYNQQMELRKQQQQQQQQQQPQTVQPPQAGEDVALGAGTARLHPVMDHAVHHRSNSTLHQEQDQSC